MTSKLSNIAVLIDADNASAKNIGKILTEIEKIGVIGCKKIYGDWGSAHIKSWQEALLKYAIEPMQQFAYVKGKNATDIGLVIEAMDLLHSGDYDGFCLVSSDSDFTSLAVRIRKSNVKVFGFGKNNTVDSFTHACDKFYYVEDLGEKSSNSNTVSKQAETITTGQWTTQQLQRQVHIVQTIDKIISSNPSAHNGWSNLSYIASQLSQNHNNIKIEKYGFKKFSDFIIALRSYDIRRQENGMWAKQKEKKNTVRKIDDNKVKSAKSQTISTVEASTSVNLLPAINVGINITSDTGIDAVLYRLTDKDKVRGDEDMIFYGQTHSEDNSIEMNQQEEGEQSLAEFRCDLGSQPKEIKQLIFVLSSELDAMQAHINYPNVQLTISNNEDDKQAELFSRTFDIRGKSAKSLLLFTLLREEAGWCFKPLHKSISGDLANLCHTYGIEISDD